LVWAIAKAEKFVGVCSGCEFVVSREGEAYDAQGTKSKSEIPDKPVAVPGILSRTSLNEYPVLARMTGGDNEHT
jgi:hypothetical protein